MAPPALGQTIFPIRELSAYHSRWTIRAKVASKSQMRTFSKGANGGGKVFSVDLCDAEGGEIRASFFNQAADAFFDKLATGKVYCFSRGAAKVANRQFNACNHRYELTFDKDAIVTEAEEGAEIETSKSLNIVEIRSVQSRTLPCRVDLCGVVTGFRAPVRFQSRDGKDLLKREITVADDSATTIDITLWGEHAKLEDSKFEGQPVVAIKAVNVKEWNGGRGGSIGDTGTLLFEPTTKEATRVRQWWAEGGSAQALHALSAAPGGGAGGKVPSKALSLGEIRALGSELGEQTQMFSTTARLQQVQLRKNGERQPIWYTACAELKEGMSFPCNKRVDEGGFCNSCNRAGKVAVRVLARCRFSDYSDSVWLTTFHEAATKVLAMSGDEVKEKDGADGDALERAIAARYLSEPFQLTVRAKMDTYQGEARPNITCVDGRHVPYAEHGRKKLAEIQEMLAAGA